uniref:Uncharacterized protein n=1 Tax=Aegilops tauschii TaxID=37682 RepID=M8BKH4_AEGTA
MEIPWGTSQGNSNANHDMAREQAVSWRGSSSAGSKRGIFFLVFSSVPAAFFALALVLLAVDKVEVEARSPWGFFAGTSWELCNCRMGWSKKYGMEVRRGSAVGDGVI